MKLAVISHTPHYEKDGETVGWGSTVREINHLKTLFEKVYHIAPLHTGSAPGSSLPYSSDKIKFIPLKPYGGAGLKDKLSVLTTASHNLKVIDRILKDFNKDDWVQFRAPTAMGLYVLPYLKIKNKSGLWVKYAGNWKMSNPPFSYSIQKWWLENNIQNSKVTINGYWEGQQSHILNFQNPCFDNDELRKANETGLLKDFKHKLILCFAGSLTSNKGVELILDSLNKSERKSEIAEVIFAGDGEERVKYEALAEKINLKIRFSGFIQRNELELIYEKSHIILLPSESEGFPKVIAEAAAYGCVPVVSDISSISQYFDETKSYLLQKINTAEINLKLDEAFSDREKLKSKSLECIKQSKIFTYEYYLNSLKEKIFHIK
jgi:glycosyltransferase involved in cell wall biosynthesis